MKNKRFVIAFVIGSLSGIVIELANNPNHWCIKKPGLKALATCTVFNMYGYATVMAVLAFDWLSKKGIPWWGQILLASGSVILFEAAGSKLSRIYHKGEKTWNYPKKWIPFAGGSISVVSSLGFTAGIAMFYWLIYRSFLSSPSSIMS